jgi:GNAT superfamily N-acetyltransferase
MTRLVKELSRFEQPLLERHFLALDREDRRLRFGSALNDHAILNYVASIDFERDAVFGVVDDDLAIIAAAHVGRSDDAAELGVSVLTGHRGRGIGGALLRRAHVHARNWGVRELFMHCLTENGSMMHLARRNGMDIVAASGEADAKLQLAPADAASYMSEVFDQRVALVDFALKRQLLGARRLADTFAPMVPALAQAEGKGIGSAKYQRDTTDR